MKKRYLAFISLSVLTSLLAFQNCASSSGSLNGTANAASAASGTQTTTAPLAGCILDGNGVDSGTSAPNAFFQSSAPLGVACPSATFSLCTDGVWSGAPTGTSSEAFTTCSSNRSCVYQGVAMSSGQTAIMYQIGVIARKDLCSNYEIDVTCTNGQLTELAGPKHPAASSKYPAPSSPTTTIESSLVAACRNR